jgi:serine/threonine protein kinase
MHALAVVMGVQALLWEYVAWKKLNNCNVDNPIVNRLKDRTLVLSSLNVHRVLGKGQFGKVILVSSKQTGIKYALKVLNKADIVDQGQVSVHTPVPCSLRPQCFRVASGWRVQHTPARLLNRSRRSGGLNYHPDSHQSPT